MYQLSAEFPETSPHRIAQGFTVPDKIAQRAAFKRDTKTAKTPSEKVDLSSRISLERAWKKVIPQLLAM
jgi:hypothetical protein